MTGGATRNQPAEQLRLGFGAVRRYSGPLVSRSPGPLVTLNVFLCKRAVPRAPLFFVGPPVPRSLGLVSGSSSGPLVPRYIGTSVFRPYGT